MSTLLALFRRLLFRRRATTEKSDESLKSAKIRTKSLNIPANQNSLREKNRISVKRGSQVVIRNRSQSVIVERKHVSKSVDKNSPSTTHFTIHKSSSNFGQNLAPTLSSSYRNRSGSARDSRPTVIYIHS